MFLPCRDLSSPVTLSAFPFPSAAVKQTNGPRGAMIGPYFKCEKMQRREISRGGKNDGDAQGSFYFPADEIVSHAGGNISVAGLRGMIVVN
jgi:hypothetical protein